MTDPIHPTRTRRSEYQYTFTAKHHGGGTIEDARWLPGLSRDEEFSVFDVADFEQISDADNGWLYGVLRGDDSELLDLGTWQQQIAEFPKANMGVPWHGFPVWAINDKAPSNRASQKLRPSKAVFQKMKDARLITERQRKRLFKGDHT